MSFEKGKIQRIQQILGVECIELGDKMDEGRNGLYVSYLGR